MRSSGGRGACRVDGQQGAPAECSTSARVQNALQAPHAVAVRPPAAAAVVSRASSRALCPRLPAPRCWRPTRRASTTRWRAWRARRSSCTGRSGPCWTTTRGELAAGRRGPRGQKKAQEAEGTWLLLQQLLPLLLLLLFGRCTAWGAGAGCATRIRACWRRGRLRCHAPPLPGPETLVRSLWPPAGSGTGCTSARSGWARCSATWGTSSRRQLATSTSPQVRARQGASQGRARGAQRAWPHAKAFAAGREARLSQRLPCSRLAFVPPSLPLSHAVLPLLNTRLAAPPPAVQPPAWETARRRWARRCASSTTSCRWGPLLRDQAAGHVAQVEGRRDNGLALSSGCRVWAAGEERKHASATSQHSPPLPPALASLLLQALAQVDARVEELGQRLGDLHPN